MASLRVFGPDRHGLAMFAGVATTLLLMIAVVAIGITGRVDPPMNPV